MISSVFLFSGNLILAVKKFDFHEFKFFPVTVLEQLIKAGIFLMLLFYFPSNVFSQAYDYDENIRKQVNKLVQYPGNEKKKQQLEKLYHEANEVDENGIAMLRQTGMPGIWYEVYSLYSKLDKRQKMLRALPVSTLEEIGYSYKDYDPDIREARLKAAAYFYARAGKLLEEDDPQKARTAYSELLLVADMYEQYRDIDKLLRKAITLGEPDVRFELVNNTGKDLNDAIIGELGKVFREYRAKHSPENTQEKKQGRYDFAIRVVIDRISVSKDQIKILEYKEERDILDDLYNVVDTISCTVTETHQRKSAVMEGRIRYVDNVRKMLVNTVPVRAESVFLHEYGSLHGNVNACGEETKTLVQKKEVPYPSNESIVMDAVDKFRKNVAEVILGN